MTDSPASDANANDFMAYHEAKMRGEDPPIQDGKPQGGTYRMRRSKGGPWSRVEIFPVDFGIVIEIDGQPIPESDHGRVWSFCARHAISFETFGFHEEKGFWPGEDAPPADGGEIGGNAPPVDLVSQLRDKIDAALAWIKSIGGKVTDATQLEAIATRVGSIAAARISADKQREKDKAPHLAKCREIDEAANPTIKEAAKVEAQLKALGAVWANEQRAKETAAAEARRAEEEAARAAAPARRADGDETNVVPLAPPASAPSAPKTYTGTTGKKLKEKDVSVAVIEDQDAVYQFFKQEPEVVALLKKLAQRCVDSNVTCPGVKIEKEVKLA